FQLRVRDLTESKLFRALVRLIFERIRVRSFNIRTIIFVRVCSFLGSKCSYSLVYIVELVRELFKLFDKFVFVLFDMFLFVSVVFFKVHYKLFCFIFDIFSYLYILLYMYILYINL
ncbi:Unknown protein, partial [Striga hermonthica]